MYAMKDFSGSPHLIHFFVVCVEISLEVMFIM